MNPPADDNLDRDSFYADDEDDEEGEYELEPVDAEVLEHQRRMAQAEVIRAETAAQIDQVYDDTTLSRDVENFAQDFRFRFQLKHLLGATAGLAIFMSLGKLLRSGVAATVVVALVVLSAIHLFLGYREKQRLEMLSRKRARLVELARRKAAASDEELVNPSMYEAGIDDDEPEARPKRPPLKIAFSMREVLIAMTISAVTLGLVGLLPAGLPAALLGLVAVGGLAAYAVGFEAPPTVVLGWWVILAMYVVLTVGGQFFAAP